MTRYPAELTETRETGTLGHRDMLGAAWGVCQIRLVADRVANRRSGSTHKVYRGWRMAVALDRARRTPGRRCSRSLSIRHSWQPVSPGMPWCSCEPGCHDRWRCRGLLLVHHIDRDGRSLRRGNAGGPSTPGG